MRGGVGFLATKDAKGTKAIGVESPHDLQGVGGVAASIGICYNVRHLNNNQEKPTMNIKPKAVTALAVVCMCGSGARCSRCDRL